MLGVNFCHRSKWILSRRNTVHACSPWYQLCNYACQRGRCRRSLMRSLVRTGEYRNTMFAGSRASGDDARSIMMRLQSRRSCRSRSTPLPYRPVLLLRTARGHRSLLVHSLSSVCCCCCCAMWFQQGLRNRIQRLYENIEACATVNNYSDATATSA